MKENLIGIKVSLILAWQCLIAVPEEWQCLKCMQWSSQARDAIWNFAASRSRSRTPEK
jgi:hypothetical protein